MGNANYRRRLMEWLVHWFDERHGELLSQVDAGASTWLSFSRCSRRWSGDGMGSFTMSC